MDTICTGSSITLSVFGGVLGDSAKWFWYIDSCGGIPIDTGASIVVSPIDSTTYYVRAEGYCNRTTCVSKTIYIANSLFAPTGIISSKDTLCTGMGDSVVLIAVGMPPVYPAQRAWYADNCYGTFLGYGDSILVAPTTSTVYFLRVEGLCDTTICANKLILTASPSILATSIDASFDTICQGESSTLNLLGGSLGTYSNWVWYSGSCDGTLEFASNLDSLSVSPNVTTNYFVRAEGYCNTTLCENIIIKVDSVSVIPDSISASASSICFGDSVLLSVSGGKLAVGDNWKWYSSYCGGTSIGSGNAITVLPSFSTTYFVRAEGGNCSPSVCITRTVVVKNLPVYLSPFDTLCKDDPQLLLTNGSPDGGLYTGTGISSNTFNSFDAGIGSHIISYTYLDVVSGCVITLSDVLRVENSCFDINTVIKANTFSPNGDGVNDTWNINLGTIPNTQLTIFNKWGLKLLVSKSSIVNWDGNYLGDELPSGSYFYVLDVDKETYKGSVTILR
jgi:gliding motility-associated-like protein